MAKIAVIGIGIYLFCRSAAFWGELLYSKNKIQFCLEQSIDGREAAEILKRDEEFTKESGYEKPEAISGVCIWGEKKQAVLENKNLSRKTEADVILFCGDIELLIEGYRVPATDDIRGCLVDEQTAWELFGDSQITGMEVTCEGIPYMIRKVIPGEKKIAVFPAGSMEGRTSGIQDGLNLGEGAGEGNQENHSCLSRITVLKPAAVSMNDLQSSLYSRYGIAAILLDLQLLRGISGFFVLLVPVMVCVFVLQNFYKSYQKQQEWIWKAVMAAAALVLLILALLFIRQWVQIPYDYIPEKWSDFTFWTELWKEKANGMEYLMKIQKSILDLEWMNSFFMSIIWGVLAGTFFVAGIILLKHSEYNLEQYMTNPSDMG